MARADLMKKLFESYQRRDDDIFRATALELIDEERKKNHIILANELETILRNGFAHANSDNIKPVRDLSIFEPPPQDTEKRTSLLELRRPQRYFDDLVLDKKTLDLLDWIMYEFREWDVLQSNGLPPTRRVLFCGPSGCGKTAVAESIASNLGLPLLYVRFDAVVSSLLGETAANLRKVFEYARRGQWVILFDEFDAIGRSRDDTTEHGELKRVVNSFLQIMDSFDGRSLIIAATNFEQALDPAIWRRFDEVVRFEKPKEEQLIIFVKKRLASLQPKENYLQELVIALLGSSYADAERVCLDIRKHSVLRGEYRLYKEDVQQAIERNHYRQAILQRVPSSTNPIIDKE